MRSSSSKSISLSSVLLQHRGLLSGAALVLAIALATSFGACTSDDNPAPGNTTFTSGGAGNGGSTGTAGDQSAGGSAGDVASGGGGQGGSGVSDGGAGGPKDAALDFDPALCKTDAGCWSCPPIQQDPLSFINHCTSAQCSPFNNQTRLPVQYRDGGLPTF